MMVLHILVSFHINTLNDDTHMDDILPGGYNAQSHDIVFANNLHISSHVS